MSAPRFTEGAEPEGTSIEDRPTLNDAGNGGHWPRRPPATLDETELTRDRVDRVYHEIYGEGEHDGLRVDVQRLEGKIDWLMKDDEFVRAERDRENAMHDQRYERMYLLARAIAEKPLDATLRWCAVAVTLAICFMAAMQFFRAG
jgi:hypothetical protein